MENDYFDVKRLDNDVPVLLVNYPDGQTVTIGITYNVGGRNEWGRAPEFDGVSHFLEHQFFKGRPGEWSPIEVNQDLDELGGITNAFTTEDTTCYFTKCLNEEVDRAIELWSELLEYGEIEQKEFDKEAFVVKQEFRRFEDSPPSVLFKNLKKALFKDTSLEMDVIGTEESLSAVKLSQMEQYREKHYSLDNAALMVLGNYDKEAVFSKLNQTFGSMKVRGEKPSYKLTNYTPSTTSRLEHMHIEKDTPLLFFGMAVPTPGGKSEDRYALELLMAYMTLGQSSLLQKRLVRSGLCAFAFSFTQTFEDVGVLILVAGTPAQTFPQAHEATMKMMNDALHATISQNDLAEICDRIEYDLRESYEEPMSMLFNQATGYWRTGKFESLESNMEKLRSVTLDDFNQVRKMVLSEINGVYGTVGETRPEIGFPEGTWSGEITEIEPPKSVSK